MREDGAVELRGWSEGLTKLGVPLREGLEVILWDEDVEMEGFLRLDPTDSTWVAIPSKLGFPLHVSMKIEGEGPELSIHWDKFDGDDGFESHWIQVRTEGKRTHFELGPTVVWSLRKATRFLESAADLNAIPQKLDAQGFEIERHHTELTVAVQSDSGRLEFHIRNPRVQIDRTFLDLYDGGE
jgi:hypothetical protein